MKNATRTKPQQQFQGFLKRHRRPIKWLGIGILSVAVLVGLIFMSFQLSPWPSALLVRASFGHNDKAVLEQLQKHPPSTPPTVLSNQAYDPSNKQALLDVYMPKQSPEALPVVIWTHGGAWVSGDKANVSPYFKLMAAQGVVVVSVNYTLAPEKSYPAQIFELNAAHAYILANAERFHIDPRQVFLAGDSAGSQLSSQLAALITNPDYAKEVGIRPALTPGQLSGVVLFCGIYKVEGLVEADPNLPKLINWGDDQVVWAFSGTRSKTGPLIRQLSPYYHLTSGFPPTFISGGNADPLTDHQSKPLAAELGSLGVSVDTLFYPADHQPSLPHEYQFNLDTANGQQAFSSMIDFVRRHSAVGNSPTHH